MATIAKGPRGTLGAFLAVTLAGCANSQLPLTVAAKVLPATAAGWMSRDAASGSLLYVTNSAGTVDVYSWPALGKVGTLTDFKTPYGMCVDKSANVYIADYGAREIDEYAHGGSSPIKQLADSAGNPIACAIDEKTGNLAISNLGIDSRHPGNVLVFHQGRGKPTKYAISGFQLIWFLSYDNASDLFLDGEADSVVSLAELANGGHAFQNVAMNQTIGFPGDVQWDGKYLAVGDQSNDVVYQFAISGSTAVLAGSTSLHGASDVFQFWITGGTNRNRQGTAIVGASYGNNRVEVWDYPAGGTPTKRLAGFYGPNGVAISP